MKKINYMLMFILVILTIGCASNTDNKKLKKVDFILDWVPNTNHTGLYVAKKMNFDKDLGIDIDIKRPPEGSTSELIASGNANFGISFQDSLAKKFEKNINLKVLAAIVDNNTSGIISAKDANIVIPKDMEKHSYGTWDDPIEKSILREVMLKSGGNFDKVKLIPNIADNSIVGISNKMFDSAWVYYAWDVLMARNEGIKTNFFFIKDYSPDLNFYSPVIIANSNFIKKDKETTKKVIQAIKKGYEYAINNPKEAAEILIENAPELRDRKDFVVESQKWLSKEYARNSKGWGYIDKNRWNNFYSYLFKKKLIKVDLTEKELFTNEFLVQ